MKKQRGLVLLAALGIIWLVAGAAMVGTAVVVNNSDKAPTEQTD